MVFAAAPRKIGDRVQEPPVNLTLNGNRQQGSASFSTLTPRRQPLTRQNECYTKRQLYSLVQQSQAFLRHRHRSLVSLGFLPTPRQRTSLLLILVSPTRTALADGIESVHTLVFG